MNDLIKRRDATQATLDAVKGKPFRLGRNDCARIAASHLRRMGHQVRLPAAGSYASVRGAMKALVDRGYADLLAAMDGMGFERIAPAAAHVGDIIALPTVSPLGCLTVALTNGRALGFVDDVAEASVLQPVEYAAAWRVPFAR